MNFTGWHTVTVVGALLLSPALAQTAPQAAKNAIGWPPRLEVGQQWYASIGKLGFNVNLNIKDSDGDPSGVATDATNAKYTVFFYFNKQENLADLYLKGAKTSYRCLFSKGSVNLDNASDVTMVGAAFDYNPSAPVATDRFKQRTEPCIVSWTNAPSAPTSIQNAPDPSSSAIPAPTPATPPTVATNPSTPVSSSAVTTGTAPVKLPAAPLALAYPPKIASGQLWYLALGANGFDINLTKLGANGIGSGMATSGSAKFEAYLYSISNENRTVLELVSMTSTLSCSFGVRGAEDKVLNGDATLKIGTGNPQAVKEKCALYLVTAPAGAALLRQPLL
jgi:hypothetical protein